MSEQGGYRVLARKYRPRKFSELVGQEAMVRTLANALKHGRLAHAYLLTGVRGVGKTTTARLVARALNCVGPDGDGGPTIDPCGVCEPCRAIAESRHVDVIEMDAASRTGVDDIREIIDSVAYAPAAARYKVYIIDEVHMLSRSAFNALLKTLEEPPAHVKFIFATTEVRKLPVTVLSRCQRFDLKRIGAADLVAHLERICRAEGVTAQAGALAAIARAAEGSVRDALSLLDQAIAHGGETVDEETVRAMLGLADRAMVLEMLRSALAGRAAEALAALDRCHAFGADPAVVFADLLDHVHWLTRIKLVPDAASDPLRGEAERAMAVEMADGLGIGELSRAWQLLLKGAQEVREAPSPIQAAQMALVRLAYAARLPDPAEALRMLARDDGTSEGRASPASPTPPATTATGGPVAGAPSAVAPTQRSQRPEAASTGSRIADAGTPNTVASEGTLALAPHAIRNAARADGSDPVPDDFAALVRLFHRRRMPVLATLLKDRVRLVEYAPGRLVINGDARLPATFAGEVRRCLESWTGIGWQVVFSDTPGAPALREQELRAAEARLEAGRRHPVVAAVLEAFPDARLVEVRPARAANDTEDADDEGDTDAAGLERE